MFDRDLIRGIVLGILQEVDEDIWRNYDDPDSSEDPPFHERHLEEMVDTVVNTLEEAKGADNETEKV